MRNKMLGLALGASLLFGFQHHEALAAPATASASPTELSAAQSTITQPAYYYRRGAVVRGPAGHTCAGGRRCVGGYHNGVCRSWAACN